jgi:hypothetical protein
LYKIKLSAIGSSWINQIIQANKICSNHSFNPVCSGSGPTHRFLDQSDRPRCVCIRWWMFGEVLRSRLIAEKNWHPWAWRRVWQEQVALIARKTLSTSSIWE